MYDAIIIGGGHNGLVCAAYLAKAGRKVLVLERRPKVGGAAITEETVPGFQFSACSYVISLLRPWIIRDLDLPGRGMEILPLESTFTPFPDGRYLLRDADPERTRRNMEQFSKHDAEVFAEFGLAMGEMGRLVLDFAFGDVWSRPQLSRRDRSLVVISVLTALSLSHELEIHLRGALNHGVTRVEIEEVMMTMVLYGGFPRAIDGMHAARRVFAALDDTEGTT